MATAKIYEARQKARKALSDKRKKLAKLKQDIEKHRHSQHRQSDNSRRAQYGLRGNEIGNESSASYQDQALNGKACLWRFAHLLQESGESEEHLTAYHLAYQSQQISEHPTFRPMFSDLHIVNMRADKRRPKPTNFFKPDTNNPSHHTKDSKSSTKRKSVAFADDVSLQSTKATSHAHKKKKKKKKGKHFSVSVQHLQL